MLKEDLFIFPDMVNVSGRIKLNREGEDYVLRYSASDAAPVKEVRINPEYIADGNVAMVIYIPLNNNMIVHYGYSQLCEGMNVTHSEFLDLASLYGFMQFDRYKERVFAKVFLPRGQFSLDSDTDDYSGNAYLTADCVNPLDWQYMPTYDLIEAKVEDEKLFLTLGVCRPAVDEAEDRMYINYAGQCVKLLDGEHTYEFGYIKGENAFIGYPYSRRKGQIIDIERAVMLCIK